MDAKSPQLAPQPLKYQTWFLKVSIHCEGCRRKVKKVLKSIDGVFTATIDSQQQKVTVTGSVGVETLLKKLFRAGKHAEIWPESLSGDVKTPCKGKKKMKNEQGEAKSLENKGADEGSASVVNSTKSNSKTAGDNSPENPPAGDKGAPESGQGEGGGKRKKKKGVSGVRAGAAASCGDAPALTGFEFQNLVVGQQMGQGNLSPPRQQSISYPPETCYPPMAYVATYNNNNGLYPMTIIGNGGIGPSYCVPFSPYTFDQNGYVHFQSPPLVPFEIFSDENANGCSIM